MLTPHFRPRVPASQNKDRVAPNGVALSERPVDWWFWHVCRAVRYLRKTASGLGFSPSHLICVIVQSPHSRNDVLPIRGARGNIGFFSGRPKKPETTEIVHKRGDWMRRGLSFPSVSDQQSGKKKKGKRKVEQPLLQRGDKSESLKRTIENIIEHTQQALPSLCDLF